MINRPLRAFIDVEQWLPKQLSKINLVAADPQVIAKDSLEQGSGQVIEVFDRLTEGGAFVKVHHDGSETVEQLEKRVREHLQKEPIRPWYNPLTTVNAFGVRGKPWLEDLYRVPSPILRVSFAPSRPGQPAQELSPEALYSLFRKYGKIVDIRPQPIDSKELPRYATLIFRHTRRAVSAKSCLHGYCVNRDEEGGDSGTILKIGYQAKGKASWLWEWLLNHPRITLPLLVAFLGTFTVAIFDP